MRQRSGAASRGALLDAGHPDRQPEPAIAFRSTLRAGKVHPGLLHLARSTSHAFDFPWRTLGIPVALLTVMLTDFIAFAGLAVLYFAYDLHVNGFQPVRSRGWTASPERRSPAMVLRLTAGRIRGRRKGAFAAGNSRCRRSAEGSARMPTARRLVLGEVTRGPV